MPDDNDAQAAALVAALTPGLIDALLPKLTEHVEKQIGGLAKNSEELLAELKTSRQNADARDQALRNRLAGKVPDPIVLTKADARDVSKYQTAKLLAQQRGTTVKIER